LEKLNTALRTVGVFRGSTRRVLTPSSWNTASAAGAEFSAAASGPMPV
jgi:hypothetical protein